MRKTFERILIEQCAPTLAGMKTGSLFNYQIRSDENFQDYIICWNKKLAQKGIGITVLRQCAYRALIYVYREKKLAADLRDLKTIVFLKRLGYDTRCLGGSIQFLKERIKVCTEFPHEIGIFLGYPLQDVIGFIQNNGRKFCCCGCWKVYSDIRTAQKRFEKFKKCKTVYLDMFNRGKSLMQLTVSV